MHVLFQLNDGKQRRKKRQAGDRVRTLTAPSQTRKYVNVCNGIDRAATVRKRPALKVTLPHSDKHCSDWKYGRLPEKSWRKLSKRKVLFGLIDV
jgi:hypothetical protein